MISPSFHPAAVRATCEPRGRWSFGLTARSVALLIAGFGFLIPGILGRAPELRNAGVGCCSCSWPRYWMERDCREPRKLTAARKLVERPIARQPDRDRADHGKPGLGHHRVPS